MPSAPTLQANSLSFLYRHPQQWHDRMTPGLQNGHCQSRLLLIRSKLPPVIGARLGMDKYAEKLRRFLLETDFQLSRNVVYTGKRQFVRHSAMARDIKTAAHTLDFHVMHIEHFGEFINNLT